jgi:hypothetical protein
MGCITKSLLKLGGQNFGGTDGVDYNSPQLTMVLRCGQMVFMQSPCKVVVLVPLGISPDPWESQTIYVGRTMLNVVDCEDVNFRQNVGTPWFCFVSVHVYPNRSLDLSGRLCINRWYVDPLAWKIWLSGNRWWLWYLNTKRSQRWFNPQFLASWGKWWLPNGWNEVSQHFQVPNSKTQPSGYIRSCHVLPCFEDTTRAFRHGESTTVFHHRYYVLRWGADGTGAKTQVGRSVMDLGASA